jgi:hypothetical protein
MPRWHAGRPDLAISRFKARWRARGSAGRGYCLIMRGTVYAAFFRPFVGRFRGKVRPPKAVLVVS